MKTFLILIKVFVIGALLIISNQDLAMSSSENRAQFFTEYTNWISQLFDHGLVVVGYVVGNQWLPDSAAGQS
ncbi:MAG: hypothetical protein ACP5NS_04020 [Candidatus Pacearchaeota archaeon]